MPCHASVATFTSSKLTSLFLACREFATKMQEREYAHLLDAAWLRDADEKESPEPIMQINMRTSSFRAQSAFVVPQVSDQQEKGRRLS